ncbi:MAG TPA: N-ethylammeline chlorohydrolase [Clostridiales bacterium]|nr:N-ethylammeline chlorohydrolase [Clostridiales bacterium]
MLRNIANDMKLEDWLFGRILPLEANLQGDDYYWGTMLAACEMISSGTTCFLDMYLDMEQCAQAVLDSKMRANISKNTLTSDKKTDRGTIFDGKAYEQFVKKYRGAGNGRITTSMEIHSLYLYEPELIKQSVDLAVETNSIIHIHVLETQDEKKNIEAKYKMRALEAMDRMGMFNVPVVAAHMVHVDDVDIQFMKDKSIYPVHNPTSNLKLASGVSPVDRMLKEGICVCLGTDGAASNNNVNMIEEMHIASLIHKGVNRDSKLVSARETFQMATLNGANALNSKIGKLEEGSPADIVLLDETGIHNAPGFGDPVEQIVYSMQGSDVKTVIIDGETVMKNREIIGLDTEKIIAEVKSIRKRLES